MATAAWLFEVFLLLVSTFLALWGALGLFEYVTGQTVLIPLQNPAFPPGLQFLHFAVILVAGPLFLIGWKSRWRHTPFAMAIAYTVLGSICTVETFDYLDGLAYDIAYVVEIAAYIGISVFLFKSARMRRRFAADGTADAAVR